MTITLNATTTPIQIATTLATTAYSGSQIRDLGQMLGRDRSEKTALYTIVSSDRGKTIDCTSGTFTVSLTAAATIGNGFHVIVVNSGSGVITVDADGAETIRGPAGSATTLVLSQGQGVTLTCDGTGWLVVAATGIKSSGLATTTTDNAVSRYDGTSGNTQNSGVIIDDSNNVTGVVALTCEGVFATRTVSSGSTEYGAKVQITQSGAGIGYAFEPNVIAAGTGAAASAACVYAKASTSAGNRDHIVALQSLSSHNSTGTLVDLLGASIFIACDALAGAITNIKSIEINSPTIGGVVTNAYGLYVHPITGAGDNYAIYTNAGKVRLGGDLYVAAGFGFYIGSNVRIAGTSNVTNFYSGATSLNFYSQDGSTLFGSFGNVAGNLSLTGGVNSSSPTAGIGYSSGAGGTVTQATSKSTGVTLNKATGIITMNAASLAANTAVAFTLTDSAIAATDAVVIVHESGGSLGAYGFGSTAAGGSATITVRNLTSGALAEAIVLRFVVIKSVNA